MQKIVDILDGMRSTTIDNYVLAGLSSSLIGQEGFGSVRLFEKEAHQRDFITPHSHRFDFACLVLDGSVINHIWLETDDEQEDKFSKSKLIYRGEIGSHAKCFDRTGFYYSSDYAYGSGDAYSMKHDEIHSITFSKGAKVLFFEGPQVSDQSVIIEPVISGKIIPTYSVSDWMFNPRKQDIV